MSNVPIQCHYDHHVPRNNKYNKCPLKLTFSLRVLCQPVTATLKIGAQLMVKTRSFFCCRNVHGMSKLLQYPFFSTILNSHYNLFRFFNCSNILKVQAVYPILQTNLLIC